MKTAIIALLISVLSSCSSSQNDLSKRKSYEIYLEKLNEIRPFVNSDVFEVMDCQDKKIESLDYNLEDEDFFKNETLIDNLSNNKLNVFYYEILKKEKKINLEAYFCKNITDVKEVDPIGMCSPSLSRVISMNYPRTSERKLGEGLITYKAKLMALRGAYKTFHIRDISYSYTRQKFTAKAYFFQCF